MLTVIAVFAVASMLAPAAFRWIGRRAFYLLAVIPAAAFVHTAFYGHATPSGAARTQAYQWIPGLDLTLTFRMDALAWIMALLVTGVGALVLIYCAHYFHDHEEGLARFGAVLLAFAGVMYGLVVADDLIILFVFWEATTVFSYLLIGHTAAVKAARRAALQALVVTTAGGLAMLVGLIMLGSAAHTERLSGILADPPSGPVVTGAVILILVGVLSKSALIPFHFWLPAAMAAPTPVSAYLHAAAMVKAGIYLVARLAPGFAHTPGWQPLLLGLGIATMLVGGWRALRQTDLKLLLAYGTVSQLGFMTVMVGFGTRDAAMAGIALLIAHGLFKSTLFLVVGVIDHSAGNRDLRKLSGFGRRAPVLAIVGIVAAASMAGIPPLAGFVAKEGVYTSLLQAGGPTGYIALAGVWLGSALTVAYSARFVWGAFAVKPGVPHNEPALEHAGFVVVPVLLAAASIVAGPLAPAGNAAIAAYADTLGGSGHGYHLALWHGLGPALGLTALTLAAGLALHAGRRPIAGLQALLPSLVDANRGYRRIMAGIDKMAIGLTAKTQRGSLPAYLAVIFVVLVASLGAAAVDGGAEGIRAVHVRLWDNPAQAAIAIIMSFAAIVATRTTKRFASVVIVGATGYGMATLFAVQGAPDLALTQILIETITLVVFILVLRRLPARIGKAHGFGRRSVRAVIGAVTGIMVAGVGAIALTARSDPTISKQFAKLAKLGGHGDNIVNVTLVDIRAWDTFGEISVLVVAATGVASLIFLKQRTSNLERMGEVAKTGTFAERHRPVREGSEQRAWLLAGRTLDPRNRSIILEVVVRLIFHTAIVVSIFLLLSGHNAPGGGFAGGLVAGLALIVRYLAGGRYELAEAAPVPAGLLLGSGLALAGLTGAAGLVAGGDVLQSTWWEWDLPVLGHGEFVTSTMFDIGVYLVVVGLMLDILRSLGAEVDRQEETDDGYTPDHISEDDMYDRVREADDAETPSPLGRHTL
ncbi:Na+/H+ antiporter subunit A [Spelaeicoccus albus]|uniref:Multicomponent Na+:H+ antiporter subunit A n=1 Tax=Spelaeicoccus albus TaxID=1280376 RepID=A0A7Z0D1M4_9MICO|nr:Na+/H+ antiporter subunit A [Spelaeicoccus albus]NYI66340.1 multicomponent Na+:H+ antiporter subunit A [Spelaeicoccus albus]